MTNSASIKAMPHMGPGELSTDSKDKYMAAFRAMKQREAALNATPRVGKSSLGIGG
jgi:hypothetical protein